VVRRVGAYEILPLRDSMKEFAGLESEGSTVSEPPLDLGPTRASLIAEGHPRPQGETQIQPFADEPLRGEGETRQGNPTEKRQVCPPEPKAEGGLKRGKGSLRKRSLLA
jgi:hypothetical protein